MRARALGVLGESAVPETTIKTASARVWRRSEPIGLGEPGQPTLIRAAWARTDQSHRGRPAATLLTASRADHPPYRSAQQV
jgi:hypothetical protein